MKYTEPLTIKSEEIRATRRKSSSRKTGIFVLLFLLFWGGLIYGGFYVTKQYLTTTLGNIQQTNALHLQDMQERLASLSNELAALKGELSNTDKTLASSTGIQGELRQKIELLDAQLKDLQKSLKILKEAP